MSGAARARDPLQGLIDHYTTLRGKHRRRERFRKTQLLPARTAQLRRELGIRRRRRKRS